MSLAYFNAKYVEDSPKLWLCKPYPYREAIHKLKDIYNVKIHYKLGTINELTFEIPALVERDHELVKNPLIDKIKGYYHVKAVWNGITEYFVLIKDGCKSSDDGEFLNYTLYSTGYLLNKKIIRSYEKVSKNLSYYVRDFLEDTNWKEGSVDEELNEIDLSYEVSEATSFTCITEIAQKFGAMIVWDTINQSISFHKPENIGRNKGMKFKKGIFLESFDKEINYDEIVTRLYVYGEDGLEFRSLSPTGMNYIESLDWFMFPFECDANYNVIKSSKHLTDKLCVAIRKYEKKLSDYALIFEGLVVQKTNKQDEIQQREQELSVLKAQLKTIENELWVINRTYMDEAPSRSDWLNVMSRKKDKESEITSKESQITSLITQLVAIESAITTLQNTLKVANNFTPDQIIERNEFIHHKTYTNDSISDVKDLLEEGIRAFKELSRPPITMNLSVVNFLNDIEHAHIKDRISLGDTVIVESENLDVKVSLKIIEITRDTENGGISLTVSNEQDLKDDFAKLLDKIYSASNTSTTVDMDKYKWKQGKEAKDDLSTYINGNLDASKQVLLGGYDNSVRITDRGLISTDWDDPNSWLVINNGVMCLTNDGGNSVHLAINKNGLFANALFGKIVLANKLHIEDELGIVTIYNGLQSIYDTSSNVRVHMGRYPNPDNASQFKYGLRIYDGAIDIRSSSQNNRGIQLDDKGFRAFNSNGVRTFDVDASTGQVSIVGGINIKTHPDNNRGVEINGDGMKIFGNSGQVVFSADHYGNIFYAGRLQGATGSIDNVTGSVNNLTGSISAMDGTFKGNLQASGGTFTGALQAASGTFAGDISASSGTFNGTVTSQAVSAVTIEVDQLRANNAQVTNLSSISSDLGDITGGNINITESISIGDSIYLRGGSTGIYFNTYSQIFDNGNGDLQIEASNILRLVGAGGQIIIDGNVTVNGTLTHN